MKVTTQELPITSFKPIQVVIIVESAEEMNDIRIGLTHLVTVHKHKYNAPLLEKLLACFTRC